MLERPEFSLSRAAITIVIFSLICSILGFFWWQNTQNPSFPQTYFDEASWRRVKLILRFIRPTHSLSKSNELASKCALDNSEFVAIKLAVARLNHKLADAHRRQFLQNQYSLDLIDMLSSTEISSFRCGEILSSLNFLARISNDDKSFKNLIWKEHLTRATQSKFPPGQWVNVVERSWTMHSPWAGRPGCIFWTEHTSGNTVSNKKGKSQDDISCQNRSEAMDELPVFPGQAQLLSLLEPYRNPQHPAFQRLVGERNVVKQKHAERITGLDIQLTLDPKLQSLGQYLTDCYSGRVHTSECSSQALDRDYFENARVRLAGLAVIDSGSGRILVAASSSSPCHTFDQNRSGRQPSGCPEVDIGTVHRPTIPQEIINHALFTQAPPGSLVKPLMLAGILSQPLSAESIDGIESALMRSDSQRFLDAFLCRQRLGGGEFQTPCQRPQKSLEAAHRLGWNLGCDRTDARSMSKCGKFDLLHGIPLSEIPRNVDSRYFESGLYQPIHWPTLAGQFLVRPIRFNDGSTHIADMQLDDQQLEPLKIARCAKSGKFGYSRCKGSGLSLISEAYGQGNSRATVVGVAAMMAALNSSAIGTQQNYPHLLEAILMHDGTLDSLNFNPQEQGISGGPVGFNSAISKSIISAMEKTLTKGGTAYTACAKVAGPGACDARLGIAGKTGTPGDIDERSLSQLRDESASRTRCLEDKKLGCTELFPFPRPRYRWYAALYKSGSSLEYDKAIAVLVHSNWRLSDGRYADENSAAAEIAMRFILAARKVLRAQNQLNVQSSGGSP